MEGPIQHLAYARIYIGPHRSRRHCQTTLGSAFEISCLERELTRECIGSLILVVVVVVLVSSSTCEYKDSQFGSPVGWGYTAHA